MPTAAAFDFLAAPEKHAPAAVNVLFGDETFLRRLVLAQLNQALSDGRSELQVTTFDGETPWRDVNDELSTGSLFGGGGKRVVLIEDADDFVSLHRAKLEDYVAKPRSSAVLMLTVDSWAASTRLYKAVDQTGLQIACGVPLRGKSKDNPDLTKISKWLVAWAKKTHNIALEAAAADELLQIVGPQLGLIDQDLAKLALYVPAGGKVGPALVRDVVGGWRMRTAWQMMDDVADGKAAAGIEELDHLLRAGAEPIGIFAQVAWSLRRYAAATRLYQDSERRKSRIKLSDAALAAGFRKYPPEEVQKAERQLVQLNRQRAGKLNQWLLETDLALKGSHSTKERARLAVEHLFLRLAKEAVPPKK